MPDYLVTQPACKSDISPVFGYKGYKLDRVERSIVKDFGIILKNDRDTIALRYFTTITEFVGKLNAWTALSDHDYAIKILDVMKGMSRITNFYDRSYNATSKRGQFCIAMPYIESVKLKHAIKNQMFGDPRIYEVKLYLYKIIILFLRELQILHFSFNKYPIYDHAPIYGELSHTLYHGNILLSEIMVTKAQTEKIAMRPVLVDAGSVVGPEVLMKNNLVTQFYHKYMFEENLPREKRRGLTVHRHQLNDEKYEHPGKICSKVIKSTERLFSKYRHQRIFRDQYNIPFKDIILV
ncbi:hypothetical protein SNEBB_005573, partial [Seison nebaliae]